MAKIGRQGDGGGTKPTILTDDQIEQVEKLSGILTIDQMSDYLGITRATFYAIMRRQPEVAKRYKKGRSSIIGAVGKNLVQKALTGDNAAMMFYLKTQAGWKETTVIETQKDVTPWSSISDKNDDEHDDELDD